MTLTNDDATAQKDFIICGSEGGKERPWIAEYQTSHPAVPKRTPTYCFWLSGSIKSDNGRVSMTNDFDGILDHGCFYAAGSFLDPANRRVVWGWLKEEDLPLEYAHQKGWNGCLALPRELFLQTIRGVTSALKSSFDSITSISAIKNPSQDGTFDIQTLGVRPLAELTQLRQGSPVCVQDIALPTDSKEPYKLSAKATCWELSAAIDIGKDCQAVGLHVRHNADLSTRTTISFSPREEEIVVTRLHTNDFQDINKCDEKGPLTLFTTKQGDGLSQEALRLRIFCDGNALEIFANDRFALSTIVYTLDSGADGLSLFAEGPAGSAVFKSVEVWTDMKPIFGTR